MENKLEQLLNSLIVRGWHPFGRKYDAEKGGDFNTISFSYYNNIDEERGVANYSMRELVSKESGLWQFCEENKMLIGFSPRRRTKNAEDCYGLVRGDIEYWGSDYEYRLIEASLKDESELEDFLLNSIKID